MMSGRPSKKLFRGSIYEMLADRIAYIEMNLSFVSTRFSRHMQFFALFVVLNFKKELCWNGLQIIDSTVAMFTCCILGCKTGYQSNSNSPNCALFKFPKKTPLRKK